MVQDKPRVEQPFQAVGLAEHRHIIVEGDAGACPRLQHSIKSYIGVSADVKIGAVERSIGKAKRVIDKRGQDPFSKKGAGSP